MTSAKSVLLNGAFIIGAACLFLTPAVLGYVFKWNIGVSSVWGISGYGLFIFGFFFFRLFCRS